MKKIERLIGLLLCFIGLSVSCGGSDSLKFRDDQRLTDDETKELVNKKVMPASPDLGEDSFIANYDYPVEISIYEDGKFYYNLDNLGDGKGSWKVVDGVVHMSAKHNLSNFNMDINMNFYVYKGEGNNKYGLSFTDRFGLKEMGVNVLNKK